jgi:signal transduction histidine kinase
MPIHLPRVTAALRDVAPAVALAAAGAVEVVANASIHPKPVAFACEIALGLVLAARRRTPLLTLLAITVVSGVEILSGVAMDQPWVPLAATLAAAYNLAAHAPLERALTGFVIAVLGFTVQAIDQHKGFGNVAFGVAFTLPLFAAGRAVRVRTERAVTREREHQEQAHAAVEAERRRIARDLHDVISHSLGIVVLQAGAAEQVLVRDPDQARELLSSIRTTGQQAIGELGTLLALTRSAPADSLEPSPTLDEIGELAEKLGRVGVDVIVESRGARRPLPTAMEVSAYRIVQEALTNVAKHSGGTRAVVTLEFHPSALDIEVVDDGNGRPAPAEGTRSGLVGMRERAALFGGTVQAGPAGSGGWRVGATLPLPQ